MKQETPAESLQQTKNLFNFHNIELIVTQSALEAIANKALALNTRVRALTKVVNDCLRAIEFQLPELAQTGVTHISITEEIAKSLRIKLFDL